MKFLLFILFLLPALHLFAQYANPFSTVKYDKVIMYNFERVKESDISIIDDKGQLIKSVTKQIELDKATIQQLTIKLGDKKSYGAASASCFEPHLGFVYYLQNKITAHISICLGCNRLRSSIDIPAQKQGKTGKGNEIYYLGEGLSKNFRHFLNALLKKYNFPNQIKDGSSFGS